MELVLVVVALVAGSALPVQAGVNAALRQYTGRPELAALVSFAVGLVALFAWAGVNRVAWPTATAMARAPWWTWTGGAIGAFYVTAIIVLTPRLGVAATLALSVAGQMLAAAAMDHFGALGVAVRPFSVARLAGAALVVGGVVLMRR